MLYWVGLFKAEAQKAVTEGVNVMLAIAHKLFAQQKKQVTVKMLSTPQGDPPEDGEEA
jgi:hypothetical protein